MKEGGVVTFDLYIFFVLCSDCGGCAVGEVLFFDAECNFCEVRSLSNSESDTRVVIIV